MTYEEAMDFLNVSTETPPDMVQASAVAIVCPPLIPIYD